MPSSKVPKGYRMRVETHPLPQSRPERLAAIDSILSPGGVQKLVLDISKGIVIHRLVKDELGTVPEEAINDDIMAAVRNTEMEELLLPDNISPYEVLLTACSSINAQRLKPKCFITKLKTDVKKWLGVGGLIAQHDLFCIPLIEHKEVPEGVMLLVATEEDDAEELALSIKFEMLATPNGSTK